ncbi:MAG: T9SS type A sorting domain-containing protein, partial [Chitinophagaceae bacterium]|nr:T9SS type A sorting domain-containing protein [Chitinophagaceae bacterium]
RLYLANNDWLTLPVHLEYFKGQAEEKANMLQWKASCDGATRFFIERSSDNASFQTVGSFDVSTDACNGALGFQDDTPFAGKNYYRLKIQDEKNHISYSNTILIQRHAPNKLDAIFTPNPVTGTNASLRISANLSGKASLRLVDMAGRSVLEQALHLQQGVQIHQLNITRLSPGIYTAVLIQQEQRVQFRLIKQ